MPPLIQIYTQSTFPEQWADVQNSLAHLYTERIDGEKAENIERAIYYCNQALLVCTQGTLWADIQTTLANSYSKRIRGERVGNIENDIYHSKQALLVYTKEAFPKEWALLHNNLATAYRKRMRGDKAKNIEDAIAYYNQALLVYTSDNFPPDWAMVQANLANAYSNRIYGDTDDNIEKAIYFHKQSLLVYTQLDFPFDWAMTHNNLASAYCKRISGSLADNVELAIYHSEQAILIRTQTTFPEQWATSQNALAIAYTRRIYGDKIENINYAIYHYEQALSVYQQSAFPNQHCLTQKSLGNLYFSANRWNKAAEAYLHALAAGDLLYQSAATSEARFLELHSLRNIPVYLAYALIKSENVEERTVQEAVLIVERNRARWLSENLALGMNKPLGTPDTLWQDFLKLRTQVQELEAEGQQSEDTPTQRDYLTRSMLLTKVRKHLAEIITQIRHLDENFMPKPTFAQIQAAAQQTLLVYLLTTEAGGLALIVQPGKITPVWLDGFTDEKLREILVGPADEPVLSGWLGAYTWSGRAQRTTDPEFIAWLDTIDHITRCLWDDVMGPLAVALRTLVSPCAPGEQGPTNEAISVTIIPTGLLSLLPLHAAWTEGENAGSRRYFLDEFFVNYAPSARALTHARQTARDITNTHLLAVDEPRPVHGSALPNSAAEVATIADYFVQSHLFSHEQATRTAILAALPQAQVAHISCHGATNLENALESGLLMAHDEMLTVRDLLELQLPGARLATLSACETGIVGTNLPDEVVALPSALLQAGFAGVVASLWSVSEISTAMLMVRFYEFWQKEGMAPAQALRAAQRWVRDTTNREKRAYFRATLAATTTSPMPVSVAENFFRQLGERQQDAYDFAHPYWWAAFYLTGV